MVLERKLLKRWSTHRGLMAEGRPKGSAERMGKASHLEAMGGLKRYAPEFS